MEDLPILIFINPKSGGALGEELISVIQDDPSFHIVKLPDDAENWAQTHQDILQNPNCRIIVAGGDGSVNWVVQLLTAHFENCALPNIYRPPLAIIPLGTGNDMSRALGWQSGMTSHKINSKLSKYLTPIRETQHWEDVDIWQLTINLTSTGEIKQMQVLNYFSLGIDGQIAHNYEQKRRSSNFKSRMSSLMAYVPTSLQALTAEKPVKTYCSGFFSLNDERIDIAFKSKEKTIIFQAIPSIYAGKDVWRGDIPRAMNDQKCEVVAHKGVFSLGMEQIGIKSGRNLGQCDFAHLETTEPCYFQVDGEGLFIDSPATFEFRHFGTYPMFFNQE